MVERQGYPIERHENVATEDGYLLEIHRIPHRRDETDPDPNRPVVLLMHGLLCSSADWVNMGPEKSLAYLLVDAGYDVWMGNARGNTWSRKHVSLNPDKDHDFWKFRFVLKVWGEPKNNHQWSNWFTRAIVYLLTNHENGKQKKKWVHEISLPIQKLIFCWKIDGFHLFGMERQPLMENHIENLVAIWRI